MRFQLEFTFRDVQQFWGLEDFMNTKQMPLTNAVNLAFFMVNLSHVLLRQLRHEEPDSGILDLKAFFRGRRYAIETFNLLPEPPQPFISAQIVRIVATLRSIHRHSQRLFMPCLAKVLDCETHFHFALANLASAQINIQLKLGEILIETQQRAALSSGFAALFYGHNRIEVWELLGRAYL